MGKLAKKLDDLVGLTANGSGFGCSEAAGHNMKKKSTYSSSKSRSVTTGKLKLSVHL